MRLTHDDERARRICSLALDFMNARSPLPTSAIARAHYPDLREDAFRKAFSRDRAMLEACGISLVERRRGGGEALWEADVERSFAQGAELAPADAAALELACRPLAQDPSFPPARELRLALAKVARAFAETLAVGDAAGAGARREVATLRGCLTGRHAARVTYVDAGGRESERLIAPYAFFGLRGVLYLVAGLLDEGGNEVADHVRTYRVDRFRRVREEGAASFELPADFSVDDWRRLPFQLGPTAFEAVFRVEAGREEDVRRAVGRQGSLERRGEALVLLVPGSDVEAAASWAVAMGVRPVGPEELVGAWRRVLEGAMRDGR